MSAGSEQLCMQMPSAPRGRERISMVSGKIEEVSNRFAASPEAVRIEQYWACPPNESHSPRGYFTMQPVPVFSNRSPSCRSTIRLAQSGHSLRNIPTKYTSWQQQVSRFRYLN